MKKITSTLTALICLVFIFSSCKPTVSNVVGIYKARHNKGTETIEFKADSTYIHILKSGNDAKKQSGKWSLNKDNFLVINEWVTWVSPSPEDVSLNTPVMVAVPYNEDAIIMFAEDEDYNFYR